MAEPTDTQLATEITPTAPIEGKPVFMGFGPEDDLEWAIDRFRMRHGRDPIDYQRTGGALLLVIDIEVEP